MSRILALDQSSYSTGWSTHTNGKLTSSGLFAETDKTNVIKRIAGMSKKIINKITKYKPDLVVLEDIQLQFGNVKGYLPLAMLRGVVLVHCFNKGIRTVIYGPSTWRSMYGIKGNRDKCKAEAIALVKEKYGKTLQEDRAESILIVLFASAVENGDWVIPEKKKKRRKRK